MAVSSEADVAALVAEAERLHVVAAELNAAGRYEESKQVYAEYAAALVLADNASQHEDYETASSRLWREAEGAPVLQPDAGGVRRDRLLGCVLGGAVADAATMPLHWVYDTEKLRALVGEKRTDAAFLAQPANAFYTYAHGRNSPYGEQLLLTLQSIAERKGFSSSAYGALAFARLGEPSFDGYLDGSSKGLIRSCQAGRGVPHTGVEDDQANALARLPPLVALLAGDARLLPAVEDMIRVTQSSEIAVAHGRLAARILERCLLGAPTPEAAVRQVADETSREVGGSAAEVEARSSLAEALAAAHLSHEAAVSTLGRNCHLPGSFKSPVQRLACSVAPELGGASLNAYASAVTDTILQGGCNASRACFIGACFGACYGLDAVPMAWREQTTQYAQAAAWAETLAALRGV
jgi:ADP-ribosylglycohydrolase